MVMNTFNMRNNTGVNDCQKNEIFFSYERAFDNFKPPYT